MLKRLTDIATIVCAACALAVTGLLAFKQFRPPVATRTMDASSRPVRLPDTTWLRLSGGEHRVGPTDAPLVVVEFSDYECPACRKWETRWSSVRASGRQLAVVYRHFPLARHPMARSAAYTAECAAGQGRFGEIHSILFRLQDSIPTLTPADFAERARVADVASFERCITDVRTKRRVDADLADARLLRARGTPALVINGWFWPQHPSEAQLDSILRSGSDGK